VKKAPEKWLMFLVHPSGHIVQAHIETQRRRGGIAYRYLAYSIGGERVREFIGRAGGAAGGRERRTSSPGRRAGDTLARMLRGAANGFKAGRPTP